MANSACWADHLHFCWLVRIVTRSAEFILGANSVQRERFLRCRTEPQVDSSLLYIQHLMTMAGVTHCSTTRKHGIDRLFQDAAVTSDHCNVVCFCLSR